MATTPMNRTLKVDVVLSLQVIIRVLDTPTNDVKGKLSDSFTNYNYVGNTKVSVSIKKT